MTEPSRSWIKAGEDPLRYEYGRENPNPLIPPIKDQLAYVERERGGYFKWETYTNPHEEGASPSRKEAQEQAEEVLRRQGLLSD
jgi:hypothetical protein